MFADLFQIRLFINFYRLCVRRSVVQGYYKNLGVINTTLASVDTCRSTCLNRLYEKINTYFTTYQD